jgi:hypothetical protein
MKAEMHGPRVHEGEKASGLIDNRIESLEFYPPAGR